MHSSTRQSALNRTVVFIALMVFVVGCDRTHDGAGRSSRISELQVWVHSGQKSERRTLQDQVSRFNESQHKIRANVIIIPEGSYNSQVQAASLAGDLPDILEFDGPFVYNYVWQGHLVPIDKLLTDHTRNDLLPSIIQQGMYQGRIYSVGVFDSGLGIYASRSRLSKAGVRIPTGPGNAWSAVEFDKALAALAQRDPDHAILDLKLNYKGEWYTYAFSPVIQSAGGDLIERHDYQRAQGIINSRASIAALERVQSWIKKGYVDPNLDDAAFVKGRVALSWAGHWEYHRYHEALGDDLTVLPLPDFGHGSRTGQGSWNWGITKNCRDTQAAIHFLEFLLRPEEILAMADANGAVPATHSAIARSALYNAQGPLHLFVEQLESIAVPRPQTPAYPVITSAFQEAFQAIRNGADVKAALNKAAAVIDQDIRDNKGYPPQKRGES